MKIDQSYQDLGIKILSKLYFTLFLPREIISTEKCAGQKQNDFYRMSVMGTLSERETTLRF